MASFHNPKIYVTTPPQTPFDRWQKRKRIAALIFAIVFAIGLFWLLFFSPVFAVSDVLVEGEVPAEAKGSFEDFRGKNIFRLDTDSLETKLRSTYPHIKSLTIYRGLPNALKIAVDKRTEQMIWGSSGGGYLVDEEGVAFQKTDQNPSNLPAVIDLKNLPVELGAKVVSPVFVSFITHLTTNFQPLTGVTAKEFRVNETTFQIEVVTDRNFTVIFDTTRKPEPQLAGLKKLLEGYKGEIKEYIDLRVAGKAYVK